jgi:hypothetical protein
MRKIPSVEERFWSKVRVRDIEECWLWLGGTARFGYGTFAIKHGDLIPAHRFSWILAYGNIPDGLWILHHCDNPPCVNPLHLFLGTRKDNINDMLQKRRHWAHRGYSPITRGEKNGRARVTDAQVVEIRKRYILGQTQTELAPLFGLSRQAIGRIVRREVWS